MRRVGLEVWFNSDAVDAPLLHLVLVLKDKNNLHNVTSMPETIVEDICIKRKKARGTLQPGLV